MSLFRIGLLSLMLAACAVCALAQGSGAPAAKSRNSKVETQTSAQLREKIVALNRQMMETFKRGDLLGVSRFYADDATIFSHRGQKTQGREAIDKYWLGIKGGKDWKLEVIEVGGEGDAIYQIGTSSLTTERDGKESNYTCDFVVIWKRQPDGSYKIHVDIYN
jgi:uncharacterized protein (TIGR02246 family)